MKKNLFCIILALFFAIPNVYCKESVPVNSVKTKKQNIINKIKDKFTKKAKKPKVDKNTGEPTGYWGTLPDINKEFQYKRDINPKVTNEKTPTVEDVYKDDLKPAPLNDALFLDVIVKKEKASAYINDIQRTRKAIIALKNCIENDGDIQRFNASVNLVDLYVKNLKNKYQNTSDSFRQSYKYILNLNYEAKVLGNLKYDANYYARYVPTSQGQYSKGNIALKEQKLLVNINKTLFEISQES